MPKTAVNTAVCDICGAEVRDGSVFCFNCGGSLTNLDEPEPIPPPAEPIVARDEPPSNGAVTKHEQEPPKRKADRSDRRKVRALNREPAEIVWETRDGVSWAFVIASVIFVIIAFAIVFAAIYVR
ncbi:MAG: zinc ribbon domain-containing protein [Pyrinomonadaceae bacterium]